MILWADVESEGPSRAAGGGLVDRLPVEGAFIESQCVCTSVPTLSRGQYRLVAQERPLFVGERSCEHEAAASVSLPRHLLTRAWE